MAGVADVTPVSDSAHTCAGGRNRTPRASDNIAAPEIVVKTTPRGVPAVTQREGEFCDLLRLLWKSRAVSATFGRTKSAVLETSYRAATSSGS